MRERVSRPRPAVVSALAAAVAAGLAAGACSGLSELGGLGSGAQLGPAANKAEAADTGSELDRAIQHWGKEHAKNPRDLKAALSYAKNLKAAGQKAQALAVLQSAALYHGANRELAGEYGRLALEQGQLPVAQKLLAAADDPANPDWRIISARGTVLAGGGSYTEAIPFYERALKLAPDQPSVLSNLAMAYAANGEPAKAEPLLRRAAGQAESAAKVRQNLALVLGLQGKYEEAKEVAMRDLAPDSAASDVDYMQKIARVQPKSAAGTALAQAKAQASGNGPASAALRQGIEDAATPAPDGAWTPKVAHSQ